MDPPSSAAHPVLLTADAERRSALLEDEVHALLAPAMREMAAFVMKS
jgi:hypothetical protein